MPKPVSQNEFPEIHSDRYKILEILGSGAVGTVYKAEDTVLNITVAIKKLNKSASDSEAVRFQREAKLAGSLEHPNVLKVYDFGVTERHEPYLVLSFAEGQDLAARIKHSEPPIELPEALDLFIQITRGLSHAHQKHVVHRDIKPTNIMLLSEPPTAGERVKIVDFGMAKSGAEEQEVTRSGVGVGTPLYMSPEQARGEEVDARSDLYALGCVMYEVLTGKPPFTADSVLELLTLKVNNQFAPLSQNAHVEVPSSLERIVTRLLQSDRNERYSNADEVLRELENFRSEQTLLSGIIPEDTKIAPNRVTNSSWKPWKPVMIVALVLVFAIAPVLAIAYFMNQGEEKDERVYFFPTEKDEYAARWVRDSDLKAFIADRQGQLPKEIIFVDSRVTPAGYRKLQNSEVEAITIKRGPITRATLKALSTLRSLRTVRFQENTSVDAKGLEELATLPRLSEVNLVSQNKLTAQHMEALSNLTSLTRIVANYPSKSSSISGGFENWNRLKRLDTLYLEFTDFNDEDLANLKDLPLTKLAVSCGYISNGSLDLLANIRTLRSLRLVKNEKQLDVVRLKKLRPDLQIANYE
jgi:hypothetical protein